MTWLDAPGPVTVLGLQYGDEGKGTVVECLVRRAVLRGVEPSKVLVVRFNGGPQAAHHVVLDDGTHHVFSQFGSGSLSGARTLIARRALIAPDRIAREAMALARLGVVKPLDQLSIDGKCCVVTPWHAVLSRLRVLLPTIVDGRPRPGTTGVGVGAASRERRARGEAAVLRAADLRPAARPADEAAWLVRLRERVTAHVDWAKAEAGRLIHNASEHADGSINSSATLRRMADLLEAAQQEHTAVALHSHLATLMGTVGRCVLGGIHMSVHMSMHWSIHVSINISMHLSIHVPIHMSVRI